ncbi:MAG TPA: hypothetical protein VFW83_04500 [Bryobacteraceae bacterium]|nr:hypothetical protein [Bryobacteraceae bacterium]
MNNLALFFNDVRAAGIFNVTPTSVIVDNWSGNLTNLNASYPAGCQVGTRSLDFFPWLPFGLDPNDPGGLVDVPDRSEGNQAYSCSPFNPEFWGWTPFFNLFDQVLSQAQTAGVTIQEFDLQNEVNLTDFPVTARLIYDNSTSTPVLQTLGQKLANHGFTSTAVTVSVTNRDPAESAGDCGSVYGDSAHLMNTSELLAATGGSLIGFPPYVRFDGGMTCDNSTPFCGPPGSAGWQQCATQGMIALPATEPTRTITDMHATPCVRSNGSCETTVDATSTAANTFDDVLSYLQYRGLTANVVMIGETYSNSPNFSCNLDTQAITQQGVNGFLGSTLYSSDATNVILRPWENAAGTACATPAKIGSPSGPFTP